VRETERLCKFVLFIIIQSSAGFLSFHLSIPYNKGGLPGVLYLRGKIRL
jgi:hypothetical protein